MSNKIKKLQELTIKHNFMFCAVMMDPEICRLFLERALDMQVSKTVKKTGMIHISGVCRKECQKSKSAVRWEVRT